jgi:hypothetical protein
VLGVIVIFPRCPDVAVVHGHCVRLALAQDHGRNE